MILKNTRLMHRLIFTTILITCLFTGLKAEEATMVELRETISKLVDTKNLESAERSDWQASKAEIGKLLELHGRELKLLNEELAKAGQSAPQHEETAAALETEIASLKNARNLANEAISRNLPRLIQLSKRFPEPLLNDLNGELATLKSWNPNDDPRDVLRSLLTVINLAEQFNRRFERSTQILNNREVEVLYLGLAQAFYIGNNNQAGIGRPSAKGWDWKPMPDIRAEVLSAFEILDKKRPPSMVKLPLKID